MWGGGRGGQTSGHRDSWKEGGRSWRLLVGLLEELLEGVQEEQAAGCQEEGMTVSRWGLLNGGGWREGFCLLGGTQDLRTGSKLVEKILACGWEADGCWLQGGKKDTGPGSGAGCRADCLPPGGRLVN